MKRWKGAITRCVVFLLLGAVVNVAVAWGCVVLFERSARQSFAPVRATFHHSTWHEKSPPGFPPEPGAAQCIAESIGVRVFTVRQYTCSQVLEPNGEHLHWDGSAWSPKAEIYVSPMRGEEGPVRFPCLEQFTLRHEYMLGIVRAGFPLRSLERCQWIEGQPWPLVSLLHRGPLYSGPEFTGGVAPWGWDDSLPVSPIWPGFAVNTVFYAVVLWLLIRGPFVARRQIRRWRGRCIKCGYDLRGAPALGSGCPECGWNRAEAKA